MTNERQPVQVGIDLRPIPLEMSDGTTYHFNPDPPKEFFAEVARIKNDDGPDDDYEFVDSLRQVLAGQIVDETESQSFIERNFGLPALNAISSTYASAVLGRPT